MLIYSDGLSNQNIHDVILNYIKLKRNILKLKPEIIFYLVSRSIMSDSYKYPYEKLTNLMRSINLMDSCNEYKYLKSNFDSMSYSIN